MTNEDRINLIWSTYNGELEKIASWKKALIGAAVGAPVLAGAALLGQRHERQVDKRLSQMGRMSPGLAKQRSKSRLKRLGAHAAAGLALGAAAPWALRRGAGAASEYVEQAAMPTIRQWGKEVETAHQAGIVKALEEMIPRLKSEVSSEREVGMRQLGELIDRAKNEGLGPIAEKMEALRRTVEETPGRLGAAIEEATSVRHRLGFGGRK